MDYSHDNDTIFEISQFLSYQQILGKFKLKKSKKCVKKCVSIQKLHLYRMGRPSRTCYFYCDGFMCCLWISENAGENQ